MEKPAFTPGPWVIFSDNGLPHSVMPAGRPGDICHFSGTGAAAREANARLIAAAPALWEAGQKVMAGLLARIDAAAAAGQPVPVFDGIADLHDALSLATGEDQ